MIRSSTVLVLSGILALQARAQTPTGTSPPSNPPTPTPIPAVVPAVPVAAKSGALAQLAARAGVDAFGTRLLNLALAHGRALGLSEILSAIRDQSDRAGGVVAARVTVAAPVDEGQRARIAEGLAHAVKRRVRLKVDVDERILGGFVAQIGSEVFDASVRHAVERFQKQTKENARA